ncbi:MAG: hypothetical protein AB9880_11680 [Christensenellales bacterium]
MRRAGCLLLTFLILMVSALPVFGESKPALLYFFENYCGSCTPEQDFLETFHDLTGESSSDYAVSFYNIRYRQAREALDKAIIQFEIPGEKQLLPLLIADGRVYAGQDALWRDLPRDVLSAQDTSDSIIYYFYVTACASCAGAKAVLEALPASLSLQRGEFVFVSRVEVVPINIGEETALALSLFERYGIPEERQTAPLILLKDRYISGSEAIKRELPAALARGEALGNRIAMTQPPSGELPPMRLLSTLTAGLIGGLNPCALSMLLLLLSVLVTLGKKAGRYALLFLASKFLCYLAIGTLLAGAIHALDLDWLPLALKIFLSVYSLALILVNLWDAYAARREAYGQIRNQLPRRVRIFLHNRIQSIAADSKSGGPAMVLLGVLVAASEFLCAGQVYLATLLSGLQSGAQPGRMFLLLLVYCLAFLLPSALLAALVVKGKAVMQVSDWVRRHMAAIKLITAAFFLAVLLAAWIM